MENCNFTPFETAKLETEEDKAPKKYLLRQIFICSGIWASIFCYGLSFGSPTVFISQIRREANSSDAISMEMESCLSSTYNYSGAVSSVILAIIAKFFGRKLVFLLVSITSSIGYVIFYFSTTTIQLLISEIVHGPLTACQMTISILVLTEYTSPQYRGIFMTIKAATFFWGVWVANIMGTFLHWKNISVLAFVSSMYSILTSTNWPESPYWLVNKNKFDDCATAHRWLKGFSQASEAELETLIKSRKNTTSLPFKSQNHYRHFIQIVKSKTFYKPFSMATLMLAFYNFSGKVACEMYSLDILKSITKTESTAYTGMLILDGITVLGMYVGCVLSKILTRRTLLLGSSSVATTFLFIITLYLYIIYFEIVSENAIISISLLVAYSLAISIGPMTISVTIVGELIPVKFRHLSILFVCFTAQIFMGNILKMCPLLIHYVGTHGLFLFFAVHALGCIMFAYKVLPETKDKTLLEIQQCLLESESDVTSAECQHLQKNA